MTDPRRPSKRAMVRALLAAPQALIAQVVVPAAPEPGQAAIPHQRLRLSRPASDPASRRSPLRPESATPDTQVIMTGYQVAWRFLLGTAVLMVGILQMTESRLAALVGTVGVGAAVLVAAVQFAHDYRTSVRRDPDESDQLTSDAFGAPRWQEAIAEAVLTRDLSRKWVKVPVSLAALALIEERRHLRRECARSRAEHGRRRAELRAVAAAERERLLAERQDIWHRRLGHPAAAKSTR